MGPKTFLITLTVAVSMFFVSCDPVKRLNKLTSPIIPVEGCSGGFALRAKNAKILINDTLALGVIADLSAAAKSDLNTTDSLLKTNAKGSINANLSTAFKKYFEIDQSISEDIWNQSTAFTQLYCMLDKISSDQTVTQSIRDNANTRKIALLESQIEYNRNVKKKEVLNTNN